MKEDPNQRVSLLTPEMEHDACGIGFIAQSQKQKVPPDCRRCSENAYQYGA